MGLRSLRANFNANAFSGRLEGGYRIATPLAGITPYAAGQFTSYDLPAYAEQGGAGGNLFALNYALKNVTASRSELGLRTDRSFALTDAIFTLRGARPGLIISAPIARSQRRSSRCPARRLSSTARRNPPTLHWSRLPAEMSWATASRSLAPLKASSPTRSRVMPKKGAKVLLVSGIVSEAASEEGAFQTPSNSAFDRAKARVARSNRFMGTMIDQAVRLRNTTTTNSG